MLANERASSVFPKSLVMGDVRVHREKYDYFEPDIKLWFPDISDLLL